MVVMILGCRMVNQKISVKIWANNGCSLSRELLMKAEQCNY